MTMTPVSAIQAIMFEDSDSDGPFSTKSFQAKDDITEGVSGKQRIDTTFENTDYELLGSECNLCRGNE